ncbi:DUF2996 domain-containing protein [Leptothermofonsia sichuanensis E412]|uniref:DUF2996 domain-containing protein n=1 Tax=Leptothermofonsia sichuanensis TaxID=2917832 RepID=UPI001CA74202|nr:DUF2996 domain-containing protein [Leptothermofonsia sichuanensis]QZZ20134.1 DUF2996 domain-containing protein [Leptothermofonsia sichuanensis E412]
MAEETTPNGPGEKAPSSAEPGTPDVSAETPATSEKPAKKPAAKRSPKATEPGDVTAEDKPVPKAARKEKPPAVEDKPFADFIQQDYLPALKEGLAKQGIQDVDLSFEKKKISVHGFIDAPECWQVIGQWGSSRKQPRQFNIYFLKEDIQGAKAFSYAESGGQPSTLESFLIDERKVTLPLLVFGALQRLNAQKWLVRN